MTCSRSRLAGYWALSSGHGVLAVSAGDSSASLPEAVNRTFVRRSDAIHFRQALSALCSRPRFFPVMIPGATRTGTAKFRATRIESVPTKAIRLLQGRQMLESEIAQGLGKSAMTGQIHRLVNRLAETGFIEHTIPDKPQSRLQRHRLAARRRAWLQSPASKSEQGRRGRPKNDRTPASSRRSD